MAKQKQRLPEDDEDSIVLDFGLNIDIEEELDIDIEFSDFDFYTRYQKPKALKPIKQKFVKYSNAEKLARDLKIGAGERANVIVNGKFEFGDFIEAFIIENNAKVVDMTVSTLSYSQNNIDSFGNLVYANRLDKLNIIVSHYFYAHNRGALNYAYEELDTENCDFQIAVAEIHTKSCIFETSGGKKFVLHGSANLRSSGSIEHFTIEENPELYDFHKEFYDSIIENFQTINKDQPRIKALRGNGINNLIK